MSRWFQKATVRREMRRRSHREHNDAHFFIAGTLIFIAIVGCSVLTLNLNSELISRHTTAHSVDDTNYPRPESPRSDFLLMQSAKGAVRSIVAHDEFFHKSPPSDKIDSYFAFVQPDWEKDAERLRLRPTWQCSDGTSSPTKVVVLQMFRSASSHLRAFFKTYAEVCERSIAFVSQCIDLGIEYIMPNKPDDIWRNGKTSPRAATDCWLRYARDRADKGLSSTPDGQKNRVTTKFLQDHDIDIFSGHLPMLGQDAYWWNDVNVQYVVMLRNPLEKFVSQVLYVNDAKENITVSRAVSLVNRTAHEKLSRGAWYESLASYLITPSQRDWVDREAIHWTPEQRMNLTLSNLFRYNILVGVTDRLVESVQMLAYVLDSSKEVPQLTDHFSATDKLEKSPHIKLNRTREIVKAIENDAIMAGTLKEVLKHEMVVYEYGRQLHERQYEWMLEDQAKEKQASADDEMDAPE